MAGDVPNLLAETNLIEQARAPVPEPDPQVAPGTAQPVKSPSSPPAKSNLEGSTGATVPEPETAPTANQPPRQPSRLTKSNLQGPPEAPVPEPRPAVDAHTVRTEHNSAPWVALWHDENFRVAACSIVVCVLFTIAVVVFASVFYAAGSAEDDISEPTTDTRKGSTNSTTAATGVEPIAETDKDSTDSTTAAIDVESIGARQGKPAKATSINAPHEQDDAITGDVVASRQYLVNEDDTKQTFVTSLEQSATERNGRSAVAPPRGILANHTSEPIVVAKSGDYTVQRQETTDNSTSFF
ncbi:hypothetical protein HPB48_001335 [Haemaphysalis longicornis]|uniref:Transmembrane protein n=1 Tax=Haemaphysalis longicornis TaxID=44386 RepID=A0A9J6GD57_HAELO|nr:hypothetical protein HPB48_001335 [Haemaphysalis longicornis]